LVLLRCVAVYLEYRRRQAGPHFDPDLVELLVSRGIIERFA
jgi:hypothetical protein